MAKQCYHCGEYIPAGINLFVEINQQMQPMCCVGCQAVAELIIANDLSEYYQFRTQNAEKSIPLVPEELAKKKLLDDEELQSEFTFNHDGIKESILSIEGVNCAACAWLIEKQLSNLKGVHRINVNATSARANVQWNDEECSLSDILIAIEKVGYHALPYKANTAEAANKKQSKAFIKRLGISGILMMQVMMIAVGLYFGDYSDMANHNALYLRWVSLALATPIIIYGAYPFYLGAYRALKAKRLSMDVPVSIAIILAFTASMWATVMNEGEVYFESVSMFTFLLLIGKFLEFRARSRAADVSSNLLKMMPMTATKLNNDEETLLLARHCKEDDILLIKPGEVIPADGAILDGNSQVNEAMLTGEQLPVNKKQYDDVFAGTINGDGHLTVKVNKAPEHSFLNQLIRLSESAQHHKPRIAQLSDKIAQYFVALILLVSIATAIYWLQHKPDEAFWITLAVLVATCPCALSLATPAALTCATTRLNKSGILIKSGHVMETLPAVNCIAFDKTGTLTSGIFSLQKAYNYAENTYSQSEILNIAAALEAYSEHPIAKAFNAYRDYQTNMENIQVHAGHGVSGTINNKHYLIGKLTWAAERLDIEHLLQQYTELDKNQCVLVENSKVEDKHQLIASFFLADDIRDDAQELISELKAKHIQTVMLSGDHANGCQLVQDKIKLDQYYSALTADDKLSHIKSMQDNHVVAMVGDGINDTPVLGAAHLSVAMGCGADIAKNGADVILLNNRLSSLKTLQNIGRATQRVIWQNYGWAIGYNAFILPLAVSGYITPYFAVIGMSLSSLLVISNSLRLLRK